jgi:hypothetical protein
MSEDHDVARALVGAADLEDGMLPLPISLIPDFIASLDECHPKRGDATCAEHLADSVREDHDCPPYSDAEIGASIDRVLAMARARIFDSHIDAAN